MGTVFELHFDVNLAAQCRFCISYLLEEPPSTERELKGSYGILIVELIKLKKRWCGVLHPSLYLLLKKSEKRLI